jgi:hypothetical protein
LSIIQIRYSSVPAPAGRKYTLADSCDASQDGNLAPRGATVRPGAARGALW